MGQIKMMKKTMALHYREGKPVVYQLRQLKYPPIEKDVLVNYIANSANVPPATVEAAIAAITEGILYFTVNGHRVVFPKFGGFYVNVRTKVSRSLEELTPADSVKSMRLAFAPEMALREGMADTGTDIVTGGAYGGEPEDGD